MSPEMIFNKPYSRGTDVFSFGCVLVEIVCGRAPGGGTEGRTLQRLPQNGFDVDANEIRNASLSGAPPSLVELAVQCCEYEPEDRPTANDVYEWLVDLLSELDEAEVRGGPQQHRSPPIAPLLGRRCLSGASPRASRAQQSKLVLRQMLLLLQQMQQTRQGARLGLLVL